MIDRKSISVAILTAAVFLAVDALTPAYVAYELRIFVFAVCLLAVCSALMDGPKSGFTCGLIVFAAQGAATFLRYAVVWGVDIAIVLLPYSIVLISSYLIVGILGGYLGGYLGAPGHLQARSRTSEPRQ